MVQSVGFIGVGDLAEYTIKGLRLGGYAGHIYLSPRNAAMSEKLAEECDGEILANNQAIADQSDCLIISTRPAHCLAALKALRFKPSQLLVSVVAGVSEAELRTVVPSHVMIVRAMPVSSAQAGASPTLIYPDHPTVTTLFSYCGDSISVDTEAAYDQGSVLACVYTWYFSLFGQLIDSTTNEALPADKAKALVLGMAKGAASLAIQRSETAGEIAEAIATDGTFSKLGLDLLKDNNAFAPWDEACELLLKRL